MNKSNRLIQILEDENSDVSEKRRAILKLGRLGEENAVDALLNSLDSDNQEVLVSTLWALGEIEEERVTVYLRRFFSTDLEERLQLETITAASKIEGPSSELEEILNTALNSPYVDVRKRAVCEAGRGSFIASTTLRSMYHSEKDEEVRSLIVYSLGSILSDFERLKFLINAVEEGGKAGKTAMWELDETKMSLGKFERHEDEIAPYLSHENKWVRKTVVEAFKYIDGYDLELWQMAVNENSEIVRKSALEGLRISEILDKIKIKEEDLRIFSESSNKEVRREISSKIRNGTILNGKDVVLNLVEDSDPEVRKEAVEALRTLEEQKFPGERYIHFWNELPYQTIKEYGKSFDQEALEIASERLHKEENEEVLTSIIHFARLSGDKRFQSKLRRIYSDNYNIGVRKAAVSAIGTTSDNDRTLKRFLQSQLEERKDPKIRESLVESLGNIHDEEVVEYLIEITRDPETYDILRSAKDALSYINTERAVERLEQLQSNDRVDYEEYVDYRNSKITKFTTERASNIIKSVDGSVARFKRLLKQKTWPIRRRIPRNPLVTLIRKITFKLFEITFNLFLLALAMLAFVTVLAIFVTII